MIELQLKKGDQIYDFTFPSAASGGDPGMSNEGVINASFKRKRITKTHSGLFWMKTTTIEANDQIEFKWLPWVDGKINYCSQQGVDVLSGFYSGCWMARYVEGDGRVCHIALQDGIKDCKQAWREKSATVTNVAQFCPHVSIRGSKILGLVTNTGAFFAIGLDPLSKLDIENPWKTAEKWKLEVPMLSDEMAKEFAAKKEVPFGNIYKGLAYLVVEVKGPITPQVFPT
jgi:hypothetical protein